ncbi:DUF3298 and DUF4163 domain-containing protein [Pareuzebyella sediminis]|uniref:DUF3298 and DUF4163 domain-containing protein n=1 Tax=Pareuzebyella sediminis TaxID=2607998 RepID=UPI0011EC5D83|nr:DUF3298 and DUF4163 domain-containing protein [Pareuzebyella sediminis]
MRIQISFIAFFLLLTSCQEETDLTFETLTLDETRCSECPMVEIQIPKAMENSKTAESINTILTEEIIEILNFDDEMEAISIKEAVQSFSNGYWALKKLYPDETMGWEAKIKGIVTYEDPLLLTIEIDSYLYTGGAHGYSSKHYLNFDKRKAKELENWQLFKNREDFQKFAELKFRTQEQIPIGKPINSTGLMFERDSFYLPENIGFTKDGVTLLYNPYEVASYADGPITLTLKFEEVKPYLISKVKS